MSYQHNYNPKHYDGVPSQPNLNQQQYDSGYPNNQQQQSFCPYAMKATPNIQLPNFSVPPPNFLLSPSVRASNIESKSSGSRSYSDRSHSSRAYSQDRERSESTRWRDQSPSRHSHKRPHQTHRQSNERCHRSEYRSYSRERNKDRDRAKYPSGYSSSHTSSSAPRKKREHSDSKRSSHDERSSRESTRKRKASPKRRSGESERHVAAAEKTPPKSREDRSERRQILEKWCSNFCETSEDISRKLEELADDNDKNCWIRSSPADLFYRRSPTSEMESTSKLDVLCTLFHKELIERGEQARKDKPAVAAQPKKIRQRICRHKSKYRTCFDFWCDCLAYSYILRCFQFSREMLLIRIIIRRRF